MFIIPKKISSSTAFNGKRYERGSIVYDNTNKLSEIEKKYQPMIAQLNGLVKDINTEISTNKRKAKEMMDLYPKKVEIELESAKNRSTLYTTKMNVLKLIMGAVKEVKELELKEQKQIFDMTGKNVDVRGGNTSEKVFAARAVEVAPGETRKSLHSLPSYYAQSTPEETQSQYVETKEEVEATPMNVQGEANYEEVQEPTDDKFTSIFGTPSETDNSKYIQGNKNMDSYDKMDHRFSYGSAETGLTNKYKNKTVQKCHYDNEKKIGWIRTYDSETNEIVEQEALVPPEYHGQIAIARSGGVMYAIDEVDNNYEVIEDKFENAPDAIKEDLLRVYGRGSNEE